MLSLVKIMIVMIMTFIKMIMRTRIILMLKMRVKVIIKKKIILVMILTTIMVKGY